MHVVDPVVSKWVAAEPDIEVYNPNSSGIAAGEHGHLEIDMPFHTANEAPHNENDIDPLSYAQPHPDDLD